MSTLKVFYDIRQNAEGSKPTDGAFLRPNDIYEAWLRSGIPFESWSHEEVPKEILFSVHGGCYVDEHFPKVLVRGFPVWSGSVAEAKVWIAGALVSAAKDALRTGSWAFVPAPGPHNRSHGFYPFSKGLMVAAEGIRRCGARRVGIIDLDQSFSTFIYGDEFAYIDHYVARESTGAVRSFIEAKVRQVAFDIELLRDVDLLVLHASVLNKDGKPFTAFQVERLYSEIFRFSKASKIPLVVVPGESFSVGVEPAELLLKLYVRVFETAWFSLSGTA